MSLKIQHRIYLALFIAVIVACGLYFIRREATPLSIDTLPTKDIATRVLPTPVPPIEVATPIHTGAVVQSFWMDDLRRYPSAVSLTNTLTSNAGAILSQLRVLPATGGYEPIFVSQGDKLYFSKSNSLAIYHLENDTVEEIDLFGSGSFEPGNRAYDFIVVPSGEIYFLTYAANLSVYDPHTGLQRYLGHSPGVANLFYQAGRVYGVRLSDSVPSFSYDLTSDTFITPLENYSHWMVSQNNEVRPIVSHDGWVYGAGVDEQAHRSIVFALDLLHNAIVTHEIPSKVNFLTPQPERGVFISTSDSTQSLLAFDADSGQLALLPLPLNIPLNNIHAMAARHDGQIYGYYYDNYTTVCQAEWDCPKYLFQYDPGTGAFKPIARLSGGVNSIQVGSDNRFYLHFLNGYQWIRWEPGIYLPHGILQSDIVKPTALALTRTIVGAHNASVQSLTCGPDGKVYGVKSETTSRDWLFWLDPRMPDQIQQAAPAVSAEGRESFLAGTALAALKDGRLVGGTNNGHLFIYDPATNATDDLGRPLPEATQITALKADANGLIYGGVASPTGVRLFTFNPKTNVITEIPLPTSETYPVWAIALAPDGKVFVSVSVSVILYDPNSQTSQVIARLDHFAKALAVDSTGTLYIGNGSTLSRYDPRSKSISNLTRVMGNEIRHLVIGQDGVLYGSIYDEYTGRGGGSWGDSKIFAYDPVARRHLQLGLASRTGPVVLTTCADGAVYGGSNTTDSNYMGPAYIFALRTDCPAGIVGTWDRLTWEADTPPSTNLTVDVLDEKGGVLLSQVSNGGSLQAIDAQQHPAIRLLANLSTTDPHVTPVLKRWRIDYTFACQK